MKQFGDVKVNKVIENHIKTKMVALDEPYTFIIKGTAGGRNSAYNSALVAYGKIKEWSEKNYAAVELIADNYKTGHGKSLKVKITDPAAFAIEELLKPCKHQNVKETSDIPGLKYHTLRVCQDCNKRLSK